MALAFIKMLLSLRTFLRKTQADSVAQLVEHNTFNVGVMGSSPIGITLRKSSV